MSENGHNGSNGSSYQNPVEQRLNHPDNAAQKEDLLAHAQLMREKLRSSFSAEALLHTAARDVYMDRVDRTMVTMPPSVEHMTPFGAQMRPRSWEEWTPQELTAVLKQAITANVQEEAAARGNNLERVESKKRGPSFIHPTLR